MAKRAGSKQSGKGPRGRAREKKHGPAGARQRVEAPRELAAGEPAPILPGEAGEHGADGAIPAVAPASVLVSMPEAWLASVLVPRESFTRLVDQAGELPDALRALADAETRAAAAEAELRAARMSLALLEQQLELARGEAGAGRSRTENGLRRWLGRVLGAARGGSDGAQRAVAHGARGADQLVGGR